MTNKEIEEKATQQAKDHIGYQWVKMPHCSTQLTNEQWKLFNDTYNRVYDSLYENS